MSFFQNVFNVEFIGNLLLGDRHHIPSFRISPNSGRMPESVFSIALKKFNLSGNDGDGNSKSVLTIKYSLESLQLKHWHNLDIQITAENLNSVSNEEIIQSLLNDEKFTSNFEVENFKDKIKISQRQKTDRLRFYIDNKGAETSLKFNKFAAVAELPSYFSRHTLQNVNNFKDSLGMLIELDLESNVDRDVINNAIDNNGVSLEYNYLNVKEDWELLEGKSGIFNFIRNTLDEENRVVEKLEYPAGAKEGYLSRKVIYKYDGTITTPYQIFEIPYTLTADDLIEP